MVYKTWNAIGLAATLLIWTAQPAAAQTATNLICNGCVGSSDIGTGAVKSAEIANSTIVSSDIKDGAINSQDIRNNAITGAKILNNTVTSVDVAPSLNLGTSGNDGDFTVKNASGTPTVRMNGDGANITNLFSNTPAQSNGLVKAWARINEDGSVHSCWRCNTDPAETLLVFPGFYFVDFTPLAADLRGRPFVGFARQNNEGGNTHGIVVDGGIAGSDFSKFSIGVFNPSGSGAFISNDFTIVIF